MPAATVERPAAEPAAELPAASPAAVGERYFEEELPPGFWDGDSDAVEHAATPNEPASPRPETGPTPDRGPGTATVQATPGTGGAGTGTDSVADDEDPGPEDAAFETLQQLFPGRVIAVESLASGDDSPEPGPSEALELSEAADPDSAEPVDDRLEP